MSPPTPSDPLTASPTLSGAKEVSPTSSGPKTLGPKHTAIAQWMIAHPMATKTLAARTFGVSPAWVSKVTNSEAFQHYLRSLDTEIAEQIILPLRDRLLGISELALERLGIAVEGSSDPKFLLDVADKTLHRLGYAPTRGPVITPAVTVQQNVYVADSAALQAARGRIHDSAAIGSPEAVRTPDRTLSAPEGVGE